MRFSVAVEYTATICTSIEGCFKTGSGGNDLKLEDIICLVSERDDTADEVVKDFNTQHLTMKGTV